MNVNEGFLRIFILQVNSEIIKVVLNFSKNMYTVYAPNGRILMRAEKLYDWQIKQMKKEIEDYMNGKCNRLPNFNSGTYWRGRTV